MKQINKMFSISPKIDSMIDTLCLEGCVRFGFGTMPRSKIIELAVKALAKEWGVKFES